MCTYYYLHYHHTHPCTRDVEYTLQYDCCENATMVRSIPSPSSPIGNANTSNGDRPSAPRSSSSATASAQAPEYVQQPCASLMYAPEYNLAEGSMIDYANPCATGGCLMSPGCSSGTCRLEDLGGRWVCCRCSRGGNTFRWCAHPMKKVPDTMCYHVVCNGCWADS